jgi:uncharacterized protein YidB (DUF937 family)
MVSHLTQMIEQHPGGLQGLVQGFRQNGLGELAQSWLSNGQNLPVSADQIQQVLGSDRVKELAAKAGISPDVASAEIAKFLPMIIDKMSPHGQVAAQAS